MTFEEVRRVALGLPGVEEGTSYGTPAFRVCKRFIARLHDELPSLVIRMEPDERELRLEAHPEVFHITDHYRGHPYVLVRLAPCPPELMSALVERAWRAAAPAKMVAARDAGRS